MKKRQKKIPPLALLIICMLLSWLISTELTSWEITFLFQKELAILAILLGLITILLAGIPLIKKHTTVDPRYPEKTTHLTINGLYSISRNPMYFGMLLILIGWNILIGNIASFIVIVAFIIYMNIFQIVPEEQALSKKFSDQYIQYCQQVRRWL